MDLPGVAEAEEHHGTGVVDLQWRNGVGAMSMELHKAVRQRSIAAVSEAEEPCGVWAVSLELPRVAEVASVECRGAAEAR